MKKLLKQIATIAILLLIHTTAHAGDHGNTLQTATPFTGSDIEGVLETTTDEDWFKIQINQPASNFIWRSRST